MTQEEIFSEIRSCFKEPFDGDTEFPFKILQSAGAGSKSLILPSLSSSYEWKAKEVASSGGTRAVYIWAQKELNAVKCQVRCSLMPVYPNQSFADDKFVCIFLLPWLLYLA